MDNRYYKYNCPPLMNDGRFLTSYLRSKTFDQYIRNINDVNSSTEYRHFLQTNGHEIINNLKAFHRENSVCTIEGKCLPLSGPTGSYDSNILNSQDTSSKWDDNLLNQDININNYSEDNFIMSTPSIKTPKNLDPKQAKQMEDNIYKQMLSDYEQTNLEYKLKNN